MNIVQKSDTYWNLKTFLLVLTKCVRTHHRAYYGILLVWPEKGFQIK